MRHGGEASRMVIQYGFILMTQLLRKQKILFLPERWTSGAACRVSSGLAGLVVKL